MPTLYRQLKKLPWAAIPATTAVSTGHGRQAHRTIKAALAPALIEFTGAQVVQVRRTVTEKGKKTVEVVYLITSDRDAAPATLAAWIRGHWEIDGSLLDSVPLTLVWGAALTKSKTSLESRRAGRPLTGCLGIATVIHTALSASTRVSIMAARRTAGGLEKVYEWEGRVRRKLPTRCAAAGAGLILAAAGLAMLSAGAAVPAQAGSCTSSTSGEICSPAIPVNATASVVAVSSSTTLTLTTTSISFPTVSSLPVTEQATTPVDGSVTSNDANGWSVSVEATSTPGATGGACGDFIGSSNAPPTGGVNDFIPTASGLFVTGSNGSASFHTPVS
ncbi:MAG: hypothetical protein ACRDNF_01250, partial [Streptosporangiaceae bacterium]